MLNETETSDPTLSSPPPSYSPNATSDESPSGNGIFKTINKHKFEGKKILYYHGIPTMSLTFSAVLH
jgi:hypothetical protein